MKMKPITQMRMLLLATLLYAGLAGQAMASPAHAGFGVSAQVVRAHQPALARALPLPLPGHVMQDDARGRHYFFEGTLASARAYYQDEMRRRGYVLIEDKAKGTLASDLRFRREREVTLVQMQATPGMGPTRISLLAMSD
jgi:hypothetical protein